VEYEPQVKGVGKFFFFWRDADSNKADDYYYYNLFFGGGCASSIFSEGRGNINISLHLKLARCRIYYTLAALLLAAAGGVDEEDVSYRRSESQMSRGTLCRHSVS